MDDRNQWSLRSSVVLFFVLCLWMQRLFLAVVCHLIELLRNVQHDNAIAGVNVGPQEVVAKKL